MGGAMTLNDRGPLPVGLMVLLKVTRRLGARIVDRSPENRGFLSTVTIRPASGQEMERRGGQVVSWGPG